MGRCLSSSSMLPACSLTILKWLPVQGMRSRRINKPLQAQELARLQLPTGKRPGLGLHSSGFPKTDKPTPLQEHELRGSAPAAGQRVVELCHEPRKGAAHAETLVMVGSWLDSACHIPAQQHGSHYVGVSAAGDRSDKPLHCAELPLKAACSSPKEGHALMVLSSEAVSRRRASGEKRTHCTPPAWPLKTVHLACLQQGHAL